MKTFRYKKHFINGPLAGVEINCHCDCADSDYAMTLMHTKAHTKEHPCRSLSASDWFATDVVEV